MAIYFFQLVIIALCGLFGNVRKNERNKKRFVLLAFGLMIIVAAMRNYTVGIDLAKHYAKNYELIAYCPWNEIPIFAEYYSYEIGYCYFCKVLTLISSNAQFFILVTSVITYSAIGFFIYRNSPDVVLSTLLFIYSCMCYMYMNILRQALAVSVVLVAYEVTKRIDNKIKKYLIFTMFVLVAYFLHTSAILCLSFIIFDNLKITRKHLFAVIGAVGLIYLFYDKAYGVILSVLGAGNNYERYLISATEGQGNMNRQSIINFLITAGAFILGFYQLVWKKRAQMKKNEGEKQVQENFLLYMGLMAMVCRLLIFRMNIINRFSYYFLPFTLILYPYAIQAIKYKTNRKIVYWFFVIIYFMYFVWMTFVYAKDFYGVIPYSFFWVID